ncbi:MAG: hypothetical protein U0Q55_18600 [Vicinamibacterales bacterium]
MPVLDLVRHAVPVLEFYLFGGVIERYALLTAFDLALGIIAIVAMTRSDDDPAFVDPRSRALPAQAASVAILALLFAAAALLVALPIGMPAFIWSLANGLDWKALLTSPGLWTQVLFMSGSAALRAHLAFTATTAVQGERPVEDADTRRAAIGANRERSQAANAAQVTLIATFVALCYVLMTFPGDRVLNLLPALYSGMLAFYDARPDIGERIFPELWRQPRPVRADAAVKRPAGRKRKR